MIRSSIDIGSNSILLLVATYHNNQFDIKANEARVTGLGKGIAQSGKFAQESMDESFRVLEEYKGIIESFGIEVADTIVTATEASRKSENSRDFFKKVRAELGFVVHIISGEGEAHYTSLGVALGSQSLNENAVIMDIGGASTEFIRVNLRKFEIVESVSFPIGAVLATEWLHEKKYHKESEKILSEKNLYGYKTNNLICVAGTMTSLGGMLKSLKKYDDNLVQGTVFELQRFSSFVDEIKSYSQDKLLTLFPFLGKRVKTIIAGALIAKDAAGVLGAHRLEISTFGLRYGTLFEGKIDGSFIISK